MDFRGFINPCVGAGGGDGSGSGGSGRNYNCVTTTTAHHPLLLLALPVAHIAGSGENQIGILDSGQTAQNPGEMIFTMYFTL